MTFKAIDKRIGKDQTTVSKEIKRHAETHKNGCSKFDELCPKPMKAPFVCSGCEHKSKSSCRFIRRLYNAKHAQADYKSVLVESRTGTPLNKETFYETEKIVSSAVKKVSTFIMLLKRIILKFQPPPFTDISRRDIIPSAVWICLVR